MAISQAIQTKIQESLQKTITSNILKTYTEKKLSSGKDDNPQIKLPQLTKVQQNKAISDSILNPMLIKSHILCGLLQKTPTSILE